MKLSAKITAFLSSHGIIRTEDSEIYIYGFDLLIADVINFSLILLIGGLCRQLGSTIIYLMIFVGLRSACGGYHAKTHIKCHICTIGAYIVFLTMQSLVSFKPWILLLGNIIAAVPIVAFALIPHGNKPLTAQVYRKNRIISILSVFILIVMTEVLCHYNRQEGITISLTLWIVSFSMIPAINFHSFILRRKQV